MDDLPHHLGKPIADMSRKQLLEVIKNLLREKERIQTAHEHHIKLIRAANS